MQSSKRMHAGLMPLINGGGKGCRASNGINCCNVKMQLINLPSIQQSKHSIFL